MGRKTYDFYCNYLANFLSGGVLANKVGMSELGIKALYDRIITKSSVKKIICISQFPLDYDRAFCSILNKRVAELFPDCSVTTSLQLFKSNLNISSSDFKRNMGLAEQRYLDEKQIFDSMSATDKSVGKLFIGGGFRKKVTKQGVALLKDNFESYQYCNSVIENEGTLFTGYMFVEVIAPDNKTLVKVRDLIYKILDASKIHSGEVTNNCSKYLSTISPTGFMTRAKTNKEFKNTLLSQENVAQLLPYKSHGFVGDGSGTLIGIDMGSRAPFILNFFKTGDRQINMFIAPSGCGKTVSCFAIALFLLDDNIHCSATDLKGKEWVKLAPFTKYVEIDVSSANGVYVNTMRLDDMNITQENCRNLYENSVNVTCSLLQTIVGFNEDSEDYRDAETVFRNAITKYFVMNGVMKDNPSTFVNTKNLNYKDLVSMIKQLSALPNFKSQETLINKIVNRCVMTIEQTTLLTGKELTVSDIIDSPLVIYSFNKNENQGESILSDRVRTLMISYLDMKKIYFRKEKKLGTCCFYEELQRNAEFSSLINFIVAVVTGARSSNVTVFLLCNSPNTLLSPSMQAITSNISSYMIGPLPEEDNEVLVKLGLRSVVPRVQQLTNDPANFKNCFVCHFNTGDVVDTVTYKAMLPPSILDRMKTRDAISS